MDLIAPVVWFAGRTNSFAIVWTGAVRGFRKGGKSRGVVTGTKKLDLTAVLLAVLVITFCASDAFAVSFTTLDAPLAVYGSEAIGISGNNIVGEYFLTNSQPAPHSELFRYDGSSFTTVPSPSGLANLAGGIDGTNIVGDFNVNSSTNKPEGFLYNGSSYKILDYPGSGGTIALGISGSNIVGL